MSSLFRVDNIKNEAILRDFLNVWTDNVKNEASLRDLFIFQSWQHKKTQQFSETSSIFAFDNIKIKAILRDFRKKMESSVQRWQPRTNAFCGFSTPPV